MSYEPSKLILFILQLFILWFININNPQIDNILTFSAISFIYNLVYYMGTQYKL